MKRLWTVCVAFETEIVNEWYINGARSWNIILVTISTELSQLLYLIYTTYNFPLEISITLTDTMDLYQNICSYRNRLYVCRLELTALGYDQCWDHVITSWLAEYRLSHAGFWAVQLCGLLLSNINWYTPVTVAERSKAYTIFACSEVGIVGLNPNKAWMIGMCVFLFCVCVFLCLGRGLATSWSLVHGVLPSLKPSWNWEISSALQSGSERRNKAGFWAVELGGQLYGDINWYIS
jgi:hypothetical protein